jgi:hypothetical protein
MKALARGGALLSFGCFFVAGLWLISLATAARNPDQPAVTILGLCLLGLGFFLGPMLWLLGERCGKRPS